MNNQKSGKLWRLTKVLYFLITLPFISILGYVFLTGISIKRGYMNYINDYYLGVLYLIILLLVYIIVTDLLKRIIGYINKGNFIGFIHYSKIQKASFVIIVFTIFVVISFLTGASDDLRAQCTQLNEGFNNEGKCVCNEGYIRENGICNETLGKILERLLPSGAYLRSIDKAPWDNNYIIGLYIEDGYKINEPNISNENMPFDYGSTNKTDGYGIIGKYHIFIYHNGEIVDDKIIPDINWGQDYQSTWSGKNINLFSYKNTKINNYCYYGREKPLELEYYDIEGNHLLNFKDINNDGKNNEIELIGTQVGYGSSMISTKIIDFDSISNNISNISNGTKAPCYY